ncbi:hypothetical protein ACOMHN_005822 [Nucella lapillus]
MACTACRTSGGRRRQMKSSCMLTLRTQRCSSVPSRQCMDHLDQAPRTPLLLTNGALLKEKKAINERWREHFSTLLNRPSTVSNEVLDQIPQRPTLDSLDLPPSLEEVHKAIQQASSGKALGKDGIPADIVKTLGTVALDTFHDFLCRWEEDTCPRSSEMPQ